MEKEGERIWEERTGGQGDTSSSGGRENCGQGVMYKRRIKNRNILSWKLFNN